MLKATKHTHDQGNTLHVFLPEILIWKEKENNKLKRDERKH